MRDPACVGRPCSQKLSFTHTGTPSNGPKLEPAFRLASASWRHHSVRQAQTAVHRMRGLWLSDTRKPRRLTCAACCTRSAPVTVAHAFNPRAVPRWSSLVHAATRSTLEHLPACNQRAACVRGQQRQTHSVPVVSFRSNDAEGNGINTCCTYLSKGESRQILAPHGFKTQAQCCLCVRCARWWRKSTTTVLIPVFMLESGLQLRLRIGRGSGCCTSQLPHLCLPVAPTRVVGCACAHCVTCAVLTPPGLVPQGW